jgi:hypothetical protein
MPIFPVILSIVALLGVGMALQRKPYTEYIPTVADLRSAPDAQTLDTYYNMMNELILGKVISDAEYDALYDAYYTRWTEFTGGTQ